MNRRQFLQNTALATGAVLAPEWAKAASNLGNPFSKADFGPDFKWGVATAAYQIEGAWNVDGKGVSIWDTFTHAKGGKKIKNRENGDMACDFYNRYPQDLDLLKQMNFNVNRFSTSWTRILPEGRGAVNQKGLDFYKKLTDETLARGLEPWVTLYHWDLPQTLHDKGGWQNREVLGWFEEYANVVTKALGDRVKNWMVLNEPAAFTGLGYLAGVHAPGLVAPGKFPAVAHHAAMVQGEGARLIRANVQGANVGSTFSCGHVHPKTDAAKHRHAAERMDILFNRLYIEPALGLGYPDFKHFDLMKGIEKHVKEGDLEKLNANFDFVGIQNYTRYQATHALVPFLWGADVKPEKRGIPKDELTEMGWEVYPEGIYKIIKQFAAYKGCPPIIVTENGSAFKDTLENGRVRDEKRIKFYQDYIGQVLRAKKEGVDIRGYFCWTFMDNFEWAEGYHPRFGLIYVDYATQKRYIKDSGLWFQEFLK